MTMNRWWLSLRLFLRFVSVIVANFVPTPYNILSVSILLVLLLFVQSQVKPFRGYWQNVLDEVLVLNLILLLVDTSILLTSILLIALIWKELKCMVLY